MKIGASTVTAIFLGTTAITSAYLGTTQVFGGSTFSPSSLFASSEPGVWYDPSDLTTLFTDTAGTTPVVTPGQTVALMLDKSKGAGFDGTNFTGLGTQRVPNSGNPFSTTTNWTPTNCSTSVVDGNLRLTGTGGTFARAQTTLTGLTVGAFYSFVVTLANEAAGANALATTSTGFSDAALKAFSSGQTIRWVSTATATSSTFVLYLTSNGDGAGLTVDWTSVSVRELPGFHATQATAASRPTYGVVPLGGGRNTFTFSEDFSNAIYTKNNLLAFGSGSTINATVAPDGTTTADLITPATTTALTGVDQYYNNTASAAHTLSVYVKANGANFVQLLWNAGLSSNFANFDLSAESVTAGTYTSATITSAANGFFRITITSTLAVANQRAYISVIPATNSARAAAYTGDGTSGVYIWGAQLETGSTATAYQRVTTAFDVTEAGVQSLSYLSFDGVDDFMVTPTITPGVDKAQVFAGVRKLSDAVAGVIVELGAAQSVNGSLSVVAREYAANDYGLDLRGTSGYSWQNYITFTSPITNVLSGLFDQAATTLAGELSLRVNGSAAATGSSFGGPNGNTNFAVAPLYIGRRGGTSAPFNGQIFSLLVRFGANLTTPQITDTETWVAGKTGVTL